MFYCDPCRIKNEWPEMIGFLFMASRGKCEMCGKHAACHDVPSSHLSNPEHEETNDMRITSDKPFTSTIAIIKPDAVAAGKVGAILTEIEKDFLIADMVMSRWDRPTAERFYAEHKGKDFFPELIEFMTSGPLVFCVLVADDAIAMWRKRMGATDPMKAAQGTVREMFAAKDGVVMHNAVHGSDNLASVEREVKLIRDTISMHFGFGARKIISDQEL